MFFGMRVCRLSFLKILGSVDVWGSRIKHMVREVLQKLAFHICWDSADVGVIFTWFSMAVGLILMTFGVLETGLKFFMIFDGFPGGSAAWGPLPVGGIWLLPGPQSNSQTV